MITCEYTCTIGTLIIDKNKMIIKKFIGPINKEAVKEIKLIIKWKF